MNEFLTLFSYPFFQNVLLVAFFASILVGLAGMFLDMNNLPGITGAISHTVLGGVGLASFLGVNSLIGALGVAILSSLMISYYRIFNPKAIPIITNILWGGGMALGVLFLSLSKGYQQSLSNFLFGNILLVSHQDVLNFFLLDCFLLLIIAMFFRQLVLLSFSVNFARLQNLPIFLLNFILIMIISFSILNLVKTVGIALALVLLNVPSYVARHFTKTLKGNIFLAFLFSFVSMIAGFFLSYEFNTPAGATIALFCIFLYSLVSIKHLFAHKGRGMKK